MPNIVYKKNILYFIILFTFHKLFVYCDVDCSEYTDCFNCTMCGDINSKYCNCLWTNYGGIAVCQTDEFRYLSEWYTELKSCTNNEDQNTYCSGEDTIYSTDDLNSENSITFHIHSDNYGKYGKKMLFCYFNYLDENSGDYTIKIKFSSSIENKPKVAYGCGFTDKTQEKIQNIENDKEISCSRSNNIFFVSLLKEQYSSSPITFKLTLKSGSLYKYVTAFSVAIMLLLLITCVICCITRLYNNKARRQLRILMNQRARENMLRIQQENMNMANYNDDSENLEEINKEKLDELFSKQMIEHTYKSEYNKYGGGCSICLEDFKKKSKVSKTPCNHVFHYKCIKDWLYKNVKNPKCPNCNKEVVSDDINIEEKNDQAKIIKVKKKAQNNNNNNNSNNNNHNNVLNNNLNFGGRNNIAVTININRGSNNFNSGIRGDISQSQRQQLGDY